VNIDHVATIREARKTDEPDPVSAAATVEMAGADQVTIHLREDRRHIQNRDARLIREVTRTAMNLEMAATVEMQEIALALHPDSVTLVPEKREEVTTEGGLDLKNAGPSLGDMIATIKDAGIKACAFLDPDLEQIKEAARLHFAHTPMRRRAIAGPSFKRSPMLPWPFLTWEWRSTPGTVSPTTTSTPSSRCPISKS
jgi:pyridoxine 5-phosphate synthase